jgi:hypothetical protein
MAGHSQRRSSLGTVKSSAAAELPISIATCASVGPTAASGQALADWTQDPSKAAKEMRINLAILVLTVPAIAIEHFDWHQTATNISGAQVDAPNWCEAIAPERPLTA